MAHFLVHQRTSVISSKIFVFSLVIAVSAFTFWFLIIVGPGPTVAPTN